MLAKRLGEVVVAGEVLLGAEEEIMVVFGVEDGFHCRDGWDADGSGRQTGIFIGVIGGLDFLVAVKHPLDGIVVPCEDKRGVGL